MMDDTPPFVSCLGTLMAVVTVIGIFAMLVYLLLSGMITWVVGLIVLAVVYFVVVQTTKI